MFSNERQHHPSWPSAYFALCKEGRQRAYATVGANAFTLWQYLPMLLPSPNDEEVEMFQKLYEADFGHRLDQRDAVRLATLLIRFVYLTDNPGVPIAPRDQLLSINEPPCDTSFMPVSPARRKQNKSNLSTTKFKPSDRLSKAGILKSSEP